MSHTSRSPRRRWPRAVAQLAGGMAIGSLVLMLVSCGDDVTGPPTKRSDATASGPVVLGDVATGTPVQPIVLEPPRYHYYQPVDLNDNGDVLGSSGGWFIVWRATGDVVEAPWWLGLRRVLGIGNNGLVIGSLSPRAVAWNPATGGLIFPPDLYAGTYSTEPLYMSREGTSVVGVYLAQPQPPCTSMSAAFSWGVTSGSFGRYGGCGYSPTQADAGKARGTVNDKGEAIVQQGSQAYLLRGSTLVPLASLGGCCSYATKLNERSQVVGTATTASGSIRPVMWDPDGYRQPFDLDAGGPYAGEEGTPIMLTATVTGWTGAVQYSWKIGDEVVSDRASFAHAFDDDGSFGISVTATSARGTYTAATTGTIVNVPPHVSVAPGGTILSGDPFTVRARFEDPGVLDAPWRWSVREAGGALLAEGAAGTTPDSVRAPVVLRRAGTHVLTLAVTDADGGAGSASTTVTVLRRPLPMTVAPASRHAASRGNGLLTVTLAATPSVRMADVVVGSIRLGNTPPASRGNGTPMATLEDVNGDGVPELVLKFRRPDIVLADVLVLHADLMDGRQVEGRWTW